MNTQIKPWKVITKRDDPNEAQPVGVILQVDEESGAYWWSPFPERQEVQTNGRAKTRGRTKHHLPAPRKSEIAKLLEDIDSGKSYLGDLAHVGLQAMHVADIEELATKASEPSATTYRRALQIMQTQWAWIEPFARRAGTGLAVYLDSDAVAAHARAVAERTGVSEGQVIRAIRAYLLGGMRREALLPAWGRCGAPGKPRFPRPDTHGDFTKRSGRRNPAARKGVAGHLGMLATDDVREKLRSGWRKFKTSKKISVAKAYALTLAEYWAERVDVTARSRRITLLPVERLPTLDQFRHHGPGSDPKRSARRINIGQHRWERDYRQQYGSERSGLRAAGQCASIDSTSDDQNLVLSVDRTVLLPSSWNTKVRETYTGYIASFYSGFERPSTMTSLIAIAMAADSKVEFCARHGVTITDDDWLPLNFRRVRADNGEVKSEAGIATLTASATTLEFVQSYAAERKNGVESAHYQLQVGATHELPGSTQGQIRRRGDEDPSKDACLTHSEYVHHAIRFILRHNNVERVEHLLTLEMRRDKVEPTRASILKWMIKNGYVVSDSPAQSQLRAMCLPRLRAKISAAGVRIDDPSTKDHRYVPSVLYNSPALRETGLTDQGLSQDVWVHLNPNHLGTAWLSHRNGLVEMHLQTHDPELGSLSLREWLEIAESDRLNAYLSSGKRLEVLANDGTARYDSAKDAKKMRAEHQATKKAALPEGKVTKPKAALKQAQLDQTERLGLAGLAASGVNQHADRHDIPANEPAWVSRARATNKF